MSTATASPYLRPDAQRGYGASLIERGLREAPESVLAMLRKYPLTDDQVGYLRALAEHGANTFVWGNASTSNRLDAALVNKGVAIRQTGGDTGVRGGGRVVPAPYIREAYLAQKAESDREYAARKEAEAAANREKHAALVAERESALRTLGAALDVALQEGALERTSPGVVAAQALLARLTEAGVQRWQGAW